ncbi:hypothetical protein RFI_26219 [Reticulomyxa filosa]|uniref:Uncharacterized protein n=1 Tax=Reticulomyxa filosa TaxID=46433 RepID=X6MBV2_RETFI|nr:hypothetical protein RFI_26219 [Reticulomyxa filosa]|eukprot:ETO11156.1 hypothetical protein RFI_26219 [Reticulomyxa filosa]
MDTIFFELLKGVSKGLFGAYLFLSPLFIEDEFRRLPPFVSIGKLFLPVFAISKAVYGILHLSVKVETKEITRFLVTMTFFYILTLHNCIDLSESVSGKGDNQPSNEVLLPSWQGKIRNNSLLLSELYSMKEYPEMTYAASQINVNAPNFQVYHWCLLLGTASAITFHSMLPQMNYLGRYLYLGFAFVYYYFFFFVELFQNIHVYGICNLFWVEFQRPYLYWLPKHLMSSQENFNFVYKILLGVSFVLIGSALCVWHAKYQQIGIVVCVMSLIPVVSYEIQAFIWSSFKRQLVESKLEYAEFKLDLHKVMAWHKLFVFPLPYQCLRLLHWFAIFSGLLFQSSQIFLEHISSTQPLPDITIDANKDKTD